VPRLAWPAAKALPLNPLSASRSRGGGPVSNRSLPTSRSFTAAGTMLQARTMRLPRSVLMAMRKPQDHSACPASRPNRACSPSGPVQESRAADS